MGRGSFPRPSLQTYRPPDLFDRHDLPDPDPDPPDPPDPRDLSDPR